MWRFHELVNHILQYLAPSKKKKYINRNSSSSSMYQTWSLPSRKSRDSFPLPTLHRMLVPFHSWNPGLPAHSAAPCPTSEEMAQRPFQGPQRTSSPPEQSIPGQQKPWWSCSYSWENFRLNVYTDYLTPGNHDIILLLIGTSEQNGV